MVMDGHTDFMDLLQGNTTDVLNNEGEIHVYVPHDREFDQQLDMDEFIDPNDFSTILPTLDILAADDGTYYPEEGMKAPPTELCELTSPEDLNQQLYFQYPAVIECTEVSDLNAISNTSTDLTRLSEFDPDSSFSVAPPTPGSPADSVFTTPPTPATASSVDSGFGSSGPATPPTSSLKTEMKHHIQSRRRLEGKGELQVNFVEPEPERLTEEEEERRVERREKNKQAAQKCRGKKKERGDVLEVEVHRLEGIGNKLNIDIQKLIQERDHLRDSINIHRPYCPKMRSNSEPL